MSFQPDRAAALLLAAWTLALPAWSQTPPACEPAAGAPAWLPCGPDRVLSEADFETYLFKPGQTTQMEMTGGTSGRTFVLQMRPGGKLELSVKGATNFGRDWKLEGNKFCMRAYQGVWNGQFNCGGFEVAQGKLFWLDGSDNSRNPINSVVFSTP